MRKVGRKIRRLRRQVGLTREALALITGIDEAELFAIEKGRYEPDLLTLGKIARALYTETEELLEPEPDNTWVPYRYQE